MTDPAPRPLPITSSPAPLSPAPTRDAREQAITELTRHFAEDRLSLDEFDRRAELAYAVTTTADLAALTADVAAPTLPATEESRPIVAIFSNQERSGGGVVPRRQRVSCTFGNVELDLLKATFAQGISEIDVSCVFGNVEIVVPAHVRVEVTGSAILGSFGARAGAGAGDASVVLRVTGRAVFGTVEVRSWRAGAPAAFPAPER